MADNSEGQYPEGTTFFGRIKRLLKLPVSQEERISSARLGLVSLVSSAGIYLLRGLTSLTVPGILIAVVLGAGSWWLYGKYDKQRSVSYLVGIVAAVSLFNAIPALSGLGGLVLGVSGVATFFFGAWKLVSTVLSVFRGTRE